MKRLRLLCIIAAFICTVALLCSCDYGNPDETDPGYYPEGSIALTKENFSEYFELKTTATCDFNTYTNSTQAVAYVAFIPKHGYKEAVGRVVLDVETRVYNPAGGFDVKIVNDEAVVYLDGSVTNKNWKMTFQPNDSLSVSYKIKPDTYDGIYNILHKTAQA